MAWWRALQVSCLVATLSVLGLLAWDLRPHVRELRTFKSSGYEGGGEIVAASLLPLDSPALAAGDLTLRPTSSGVLVEAPGAGAQLTIPFPVEGERLIAVSVHRIDDRQAVILWQDEPAEGETWSGETRAASITLLSASEHETFADRLRERAGLPVLLALAAGALTLAVWSLRRAAPWYRGGGLSTWLEGSARDGHVLPEGGGEPLHAPGVSPGPVLYRAAQPASGAYRGVAAIEYVPGSRNMLAREHGAHATRGALAGVIAIVALGAAAATVARGEAPSTLPPSQPLQTMPQDLGKELSRRIPERIDFALSAPLRECPGAGSAVFYEGAEIEHLRTGYNAVTIRETLVNAGGEPCSVPSPIIVGDQPRDRESAGTKADTIVLAPYETKLRRVQTFTSFARRVEVRRPRGAGLILDLWRARPIAQPGQAPAPPPPAVVPREVAYVGALGTLEWSRVHVDVMLQGVRTVGFADSFVRCYELEDLALDDAFVARESALERPAWLVLDVTFLRGRLVERARCEGENAFGFVHGTDQRRIALERDSHIVPGGASRLRVPLRGDTRRVELNFGTPPSWGASVVLDLASNSVEVVRNRAEGSGHDMPVDLRSEWEGSDRNSNAYRARRFLRAMAWADEASRAAAERDDPVRLLCKSWIVDSVGQAAAAGDAAGRLREWPDRELTREVCGRNQPTP